MIISDSAHNHSYFGYDSIKCSFFTYVTFKKVISCLWIYVLVKYFYVKSLKMSCNTLRYLFCSNYYFWKWVLWVLKLLDLAHFVHFYDFLINIRWRHAMVSYCNNFLLNSATFTMYKLHYRILFIRIMIS